MAPKTSETAKGITPGDAEIPCIVKVFPDEVWPYAKMVAMKLFQHFSMHLFLHTVEALHGGHYQFLCHLLIYF